MLLTKPLRLPDGLNPLSRPAYYQGNPLTFVADAQTVPWPSHCNAGDYSPSDAPAGAAPRARGRAGSLDYELEVAVLITRPVSRRAEPAEVAAAIGGFVLINDWYCASPKIDPQPASDVHHSRARARVCVCVCDLFLFDKRYTPPAHLRVILN